MTRATRTLIGLTIAALAGGCGDATTFDALMLERTQAATITDCGSVTISPFGSCTISAQAECAVQAFENCSPAFVKLTYHTDEGDPIRYGWIVEPTTGGCEVTQFVDHSADAFKGDYGDIQEYRCAALSRIEGECSRAVADDCVLISEYDAD